MYKSDQESKINAKTLLYCRKLNKIRKSMQLIEQNYQKTKKKEILQYYKRCETILQETF